VEVRGRNVDIVPAEWLWGKNIRACTEALKSKGSVACISRAGEKQVLISMFVIDSIHSGRGGLGAVAGSKMLKAVVVKGEKEFLPSNPERFGELKTKVLKLFDASPVLSKGFANYGTSVFVKLLDYMGLIPAEIFPKEGPLLQTCSQVSISKPALSLKGKAALPAPLAAKRELKRPARLFLIMTLYGHLGLTLKILTSLP